MPLLLRRSANPDIQPGSRGYFLAADYVRRIEIPKILDRSQGDVHPQGNPHIHLQPRNIPRVAEALAERLAELDPANGTAYASSLDNFLQRWDEAVDQWSARAAALEGLRLASHHLSFSYLADWLDLDIVAALEAKPGIPPSGAQLALLLEQLTPNPPADKRTLIRRLSFDLIGLPPTPSENEKPSNWLSDRLDIPALMLPFTVGATEDVVDLFSLYDVSLQMLEEVAN